MAQSSLTETQPFIRLQLSTPQWIPVIVKDLMGPNYSRRVQRPFQPTIIDPLRIPECVRKGHLICGVFDRNDVHHWYISTNPDVPYPSLCTKDSDEFEIPCCFKSQQKYEIQASWELIGQKKAMINNYDGWVVFVDPNFEEVNLLTDKYQMINALCAIII